MLGRRNSFIAEQKYAYVSYIAAYASNMLVHELIEWLGQAVINIITFI